MRFDTTAVDASGTSWPIAWRATRRSRLGRPCTSTNPRSGTRQCRRERPGRDAEGWDAAIRVGGFLQFRETARGFYFASVPEGMPGRAASIAGNYAGEVVFESGGLRLEARPIAKTAFRCHRA